MNKYELMTIVNGALSTEEKEAILKEANDIITKAGGKVINSQTLLDNHKMSFSIKKCNSGTYLLINLEGSAGLVSKVKHDLTMNERILRFLIVKSEK